MDKNLRANFDLMVRDVLLKSFFRSTRTLKPRLWVHCLSLTWGKCATTCALTTTATLKLSSVKLNFVVAFWVVARFTLVRKSSGIRAYVEQVSKLIVPKLRIGTRCNFFAIDQDCNLLQQDRRIFNHTQRKSNPRESFVVVRARLCICERIINSYFRSQFTSDMLVRICWTFFASF